MNFMRNNFVCVPLLFAYNIMTLLILYLNINKQYIFFLQIMDTHFVLNDEEQMFKDLYYNLPVKTMAQAASLKNGERVSLSPAKINSVN